jgi:hypothetical protein
VISGQVNHYYWHTNDGGAIHPIGWYGYSYTPNHESIVDEPKWRYLTTRFGELPAYKPVTHMKWSATVDATPVSIRIDRTVSWAHISGPTTAAIYLENPDYGFYMVQKCLNQIFPVASGHYDRWLAVKPTMASRASLGVFLYELREITRMFEFLPRKHFRFSRIISNVGSGGKTSAVRDWRELFRWSNSQHLSFNFGWKPFLRDVYTVIEALRTFNDRFLKFIMESGRELTKHVGSTPVIIDLDTTDGTWSNWWLLHWRISGIIERFSTFQYTYDLPQGYTYDQMKWRAYLDSLGAKMSLSQLWAVIPWSFVWDWFYNLSAYLDSAQGTTDWLAPYITFIQSCYSVKAKLSLTGDLRNPPDMGQSMPVGSCDLEYYQRGVGLPEFDENFSTELSADKIRLLASLGASLLL